MQAFQCDRCGAVVAGAPIGPELANVAVDLATDAIAWTRVVPQLRFVVRVQPEPGGQDVQLCRSCQVRLLALVTTIAPPAPPQTIVVDSKTQPALATGAVPTSTLTLSGTALKAGV